jgi:hypothetical protein
MESKHRSTIPTPVKIVAGFMYFDFQSGFSCFFKASPRSAVANSALGAVAGGPPAYGIYCDIKGI